MVKVKETPSARQSSAGSASVASASAVSATASEQGGTVFEPEKKTTKGRVHEEKGQTKEQTKEQTKGQTKNQTKDQAKDEKWVMFDARDLVVGRLASAVASCLRGKDNPAFQAHQDSGRHVVVINTDHLHFTGNKRQQKLYYRHTGYPGGIKSRSVKELFEKNRSTDILQHAVKGMLPRGVLGRSQLKKLRLYGGEVHRQGAQQPTMIDFAGLNAKNSKR